MLKTQESNTEQTASEHSLLKLALAVITSPADAFEEILRRQLLMPGILISAIGGLLSAGVVLYNFYFLKEGSLFYLAGGSNPADTVGLLLVNALVVSLTAKYLQGEGDYAKTLTVLAWAGCVSIPAILTGLFKPVQSLGTIINLWGVVVMVMGIQQAQKITVWKSIGTLFTMLITDGVFLIWLGRYCMSSIYPAIATNVPSFAASTISLQIVTSLLVIAALAVAAKMLPKLAKGTDYRNSLIIVLLILGLAAAGALFASLHKADPVMEVVRGARAYQDEDTPDPAESVKHFQRELRYIPNDAYVKLYLAHAFSASGSYDKALAQYNEFTGSKSYPPQLVRTCTGTVHYMQGKYDDARKDFEKAVKDSPDYAEANARLALVYLRLGKNGDAVKSAKAAVKDKCEGTLAYIALAQAYTLEGNTKEAGDAMSKVKEIDEALAGRISSGPDGWKNAVMQLTPLDLRMPLKLPEIKQPVKKGNKKI
ncbi:MAG: tetratricopeptide repeat protein [Armatimonadota bacterium]